MALKGQIVSEETKQKKKETQKKRLMEKYDWTLIEPYQDVELKMSSRGRQKKYITLKQFKQKLEGDMYIQDFQKETSKALVGFFSAFCQGKIKLEKQTFIDEYEKGKSLVEIAEKYNIPKDYIGFLRQLFEIKSKGATFRHRKLTEVPLTQRQREIIYGSMMGDAKKFAPASVGFGHGPKQKSYLEWKYEELRPLATEQGIKEYSSYDKRSGNLSFSYRFYTYSNTELEEINKLFYSGLEQKKEVSTKILSNLTPLSIAVWFMDDGKTDWNHRSLKKRPNRATETHFLCADSFSFDSCENIKGWFFKRYNIKCRIKSNGFRKRSTIIKYRIVIEHESNENFINLIRPYILPLFYYKTNYQAYLKWRRND